MRAYTSAQSKALDLAAQADGIAGFELMRRAGVAAFQQITQRFPAANSLLVLAGKGNNGGDAWVVAGAALAAGWEVHIWQVAGTVSELSGEAGQARDWAFAQTPKQTNDLDLDLKHQNSEHWAGRLTDQAGFDKLLGALPIVQGSGLERPEQMVVVDGLLGTGLNAAPRPAIADAIDWINNSGLPCVALDLPSGLNADTGSAPGACVRSAITVTFIGLKLGLLTGVGPDCSGALVHETLGLNLERLGLSDGRPDTGPNSALGIEVLDVPVRALSARRPAAFKNEFGHVVVLGGDVGGGGAAMLASEAALRCGAGLVSVGTREPHISPLLARRPELMVRGIDGKLAALELLQRASVVCVGPGLGQHAWGEQLYAAAVDALVASKTRLAVVDADALNLVAAGADLPPRTVITPHPGEAARLLQCDTKTIEADRVAAVEGLARKYNCIAVLKGAGTLIADNNGLVAVCRLGNPGMATAGMGDTLAGIIAAVIAQEGMTPYWVGRAVALHAAAGDRAAARCSQASMLAGDLIDELPGLLKTAE